ncbi:MAG: glycosyltransferase family 39 protein, partial [Chloroflexota bacterium]|nr:glycosyltransferase family 39 protein [Chloroflexota bacterium]
MKTERHRGRVQGRNTDASGALPDSTAIDPTEDRADDGLADGNAETSGVQPGADLESGNGYASYDDGGSEDASLFEGNGHTPEAESPQVVLTLPRRKRRVKYAPEASEASEAPEAGVAPVAPAPPGTGVVEAPEEKVVAPPAPAGVALPPKARRKTPAPAADIEPAPSMVAAETSPVAETESGGRRWRAHLTVEGVIWFTLFALAIVTRLWDLSNRGIHHDESLHAVYGNNLYSGVGYIHDPMMHGPLQFHLIAFMYWLFGPNEMTARMASALCGIWVVMSPFFLRRQMGKVPALIASFLLLLSPSVLYFSRMAREDAIFSATEMLMIVGLWRFVSNRKPADFFVFGAGLSLMFTIKEAAYLTTAVLVGFFVLLFIIQSGHRIIAASAVYGALLGGLLLYMRANMQERDANHQIIEGSGTIAPLPIIPDVGPSYDIIARFIGDLFVHPLVLSAGFLTLLYIVAITIMFRGERARLQGAAPAAPAPTRTRPVSVTRQQVSGGTLQTRVSRGGNGAVASAHAAREVVPPALETPRATAAQAAEDDGAATEVWDPRRLDPKPGSLFARYQPGSIPHLVGALFSRPSVLLIGFLIAFAIYTVLYT